jgi:hypothetical protein
MDAIGRQWRALMLLNQNDPDDDRRIPRGAARRPRGGSINLKPTDTTLAMIKWYQSSSPGIAANQFDRELPGVALIIPPLPSLLPRYFVGF